MVEGHQCHRVAHAHRRLLLGRAFAATSPNGRFADGAAAINNKTLARIEVHGKNLFYFFGPSDRPSSATDVVHIHFGMSGAFRTMPIEDEAERPPRETTRLRLEHGGVVAHLSAMTVQHGGLGLYAEKIAKLGPDPLREDADVEELWAKVQRCKKPIGLVLMDQSMMAGVGNIYRAEILYKAGIHPEQPAHTLSRAAFDDVWRHSVELLQRGFASGSILTVDPEEAKVLGRPWTRRYVYNHAQCGRCRAAVKSWDMANRTVYCCTTCQPLLDGTEVTPARRAAIAAARGVKEFNSHCAPDDAADATPAKMTVAALKAALAARGLPAGGAKAALTARLEAALKAAPAAAAAAAKAAAGKEEEDGDGGNDAKWHKLAAMEFSGSESDADGSGSEDATDAAEAKLGAALLGDAAGAKPEPPTPAPAPATKAAAAPRAGASKRGRGGRSAGADGAVAERLAAAAAAGAGGDDDDGGAAAAVPAPAPRSRKRVKPGTAGLGRVATAAEAAAEKIAAGESRSVEHVALADAATDALAAPGGGGSAAAAAKRASKKTKRNARR